MGEGQVVPVRDPYVSLGDRHDHYSASNSIDPLSRIKVFVFRFICVDCAPVGIQQGTHSECVRHDLLPHIRPIDGPCDRVLLYQFECLSDRNGTDARVRFVECCRGGAHVLGLREWMSVVEDDNSFTVDIGQHAEHGGVPVRRFDDGASPTQFGLDIRKKNLWSGDNNRAAFRLPQDVEAPGQQ